MKTLLQTELTRTSTSRLPTEHGDFLIHVFTDSATLVEHVALVMGDVKGGTNVLTSVHSECLTGDIFSSRRCDCGEQLTLAQQKIAELGKGVIIYLRDHEGRGIGLNNKIRAYALQDYGLDTVEANMALGLPIDKRNFSAASEILNLLGVVSIRLLSNNPGKFHALSQLGTQITAMETLKVLPNEHNLNYVTVKKLKLGHL